MKTDFEFSKLKMHINRILVILLVVLAFGVFWGTELGDYLSLAYLKEMHSNIADYAENHVALSTLFYMTIYIVIAALSLPGATVMTLAGGAVFGATWGVAMVSFASAVGATLAMLIARVVLRESVESRFSKQITLVNQGLQKDGNFYLFSLRMVPLFPFFIINLAMGITSIRIWSFYWVSQIGMFPGTAIYVLAGDQIAELSSFADILSWPAMLSLTLLGLFPLIARKLVVWLNVIRSSE